MEQLICDKNEVFQPDFIYHRFGNATPVTLSEVVRFVGWGNNKLIKSGGVRVSNIKEGLIKTWKQVKNPNYIIDSKTYLATNGGRKVIVVEIEGE